MENPALAQQQLAPFPPTLVPKPAQGVAGLGLGKTQICVFRAHIQVASCPWGLL